MISQNKTINKTHYQTWRIRRSYLATVTSSLIGFLHKANTQYAVSHWPVADAHLQTDTSNVYKHSWAMVTENKNASYRKRTALLPMQPILE